jgi:hypothetical protein
MFKVVWLGIVIAVIAIGADGWVKIAYAPKWVPPFEPSAQICAKFPDSEEGRAAQGRCVARVRLRFQAWMHYVPDFGEPDYAAACPPSGATREDIECLSQFVATAQWLKKKVGD